MQQGRAPPRLWPEQELKGLNQEQIRNLRLREHDKGWNHPKVYAGQRKVFTTPLLTEANKHRDTQQFTKKNPRCQRGGVRGVANQNTSSKRAMRQTKRLSNDEAAALRKNHVVGLSLIHI